MKNWGRTKSRKNNKRVTVKGLIYLIRNRRHQVFWRQNCKTKANFAKSGSYLCHVPSSLLHWNVRKLRINFHPKVYAETITNLPKFAILFSLPARRKTSSLNFGSDLVGSGYGVGFSVFFVMSWNFYEITISLTCMSQ